MYGKRLTYTGGRMLCALYLVCSIASSLVFASAFAARVCAEEVTAAALLEAHIQADLGGTVTFTVPIDGSIRAFDFGVAFCVQEAEVVSYGFTETFLDACAGNGGTAIDHYFEEGARVSDTSRYIVFGGMANAGAVYSGDFAYVTFRLKTTQATVYVIKDSAAYAHVDGIIANGAAYTLTADAGGSAAGRESGNDTDSESSRKSAQDTAGSLSSGESGGTAEGVSAGNAAVNNSAAAETESAASAGSNADAQGKEDASSAAGGTSLKRPARTGDDAQPLRCLALLALAAFAVYCCTRRKRKSSA